MASSYRSSRKNKGGLTMGEINVLWMNNGDVELYEYIEKGEAHHLSITTCLCMTDCRHKLDDKNIRWDAVILNAEVKKIPNEIPTVKHLPNAADEIKRRKIPLFVVTSKELEFEELIRELIRQFVPDERIYNIKTEYDILFDAIRIKVSNNPKVVAREKYGVVCDFCPDVEGLLIKLENEDIKHDVTILNECRKILEWIKNNTLFSDMNISDEIRKNLIQKNKQNVPQRTYGELTLNNFRYAIGGSKKVPIFVQRSFSACLSTANPGSHILKTDDVNEVIRKGAAPYVTKTLIYEMLNVLYWCASLNDKTFRL